MDHGVPKLQRMKEYPIFEDVLLNNIFDNFLSNMMYKNKKLIYLHYNILTNTEEL